MLNISLWFDRESIKAYDRLQNMSHLDIGFG